MKKLIFAFACLLSLLPCRAATIIVGGPWGFPTIQMGIDFANPGDTVIVLPGTYSGYGNRDIDFQGKAITVCSTNPDDYSTVVATIVNCQGSETEPHRGFYFHNGEGSNSVIAGLTITNGFGHFETIEGEQTSTGGGIYCYQSSPTLYNCIVTNNRGYTYYDYGLGFHVGGLGGGIYCYQSNPQIIGCTISNNKVCKGEGGGYAFGRGGLGGGIYSKQGNLTLRNCTVTCNKTEWLEYSENWYPQGGGIYIAGGSPGISGCTISDNYSGHTGGGIYCYAVANIEDCNICNNEASGFGGGLEIGGVTTLKSCKIMNNRTGIEGGGIAVIDSTCKIANCIILKNTVYGIPGIGGGIQAAGAAISCLGSAKIVNCTIAGNRIGLFGHTGGIRCHASPIISNCIIWGNYQEEISGGSPIVTYCNVQENWPGTGNMNVEPLFANIDANDCHLQSAAGRWDPNQKTWVYDANTSLCIDAGNPGCSPGEEPEPNGNRINMGAYGGTAEASKSPPNWALLADLTNDRKVDGNDLCVFADYWLESGECVPSDLNRSLFVNLADYAVFGRQWLEIAGAGAGMTYQVGDCKMEATGSFTAQQSAETRFTVTVAGRYIRFEDTAVANCCIDRLELQMTKDGNLVTIYEIEHVTMPCLCICDYPVTAMLGPFEPGTYTLEVYQRDGAGLVWFVGSTTFIIEAEP